MQVAPRSLLTTAVYALMRFCQIKPWYDWNEWRDAVMVYERKKPEMAGRRVQGTSPASCDRSDAGPAILKTCLLRRKKDSTLDGKALITLPTKTVEVRSLEFSEEERQICTSLHGVVTRLTPRRHLRPDQVAGQVQPLPCGRHGPQELRSHPRHAPASPSDLLPPCVRRAGRRTELIEQVDR